MSFKIGDLVEVIDEDLRGNIVSFSDKRVTICCSDGFEYVYSWNQIIKTSPTKDVVEFKKVDMLLEDIERQTQVEGNVYDIRFRDKKTEFDLHILELAPDVNFKTKHDALVYQLDYVRAIIAKAVVLKIRNFVLIHGVGKGRLREELRRMLEESYPNIEYFDGDYRKYGYGATELILHGLGSSKKS